jgi:hypothetical protein
MKKASCLFFVLLFSILLLGGCSASNKSHESKRQAKKCHCPTFGSNQQPLPANYKDI